jgi:hypothetical protein
VIHPLVLACSQEEALGEVRTTSVMRALALLLILSTAACATLPAPHALEVGLSEEGYWLGYHVVFALYADGRVIYATPGDRTLSSFETVQLSPAERRALLRDLPLGRVGAFHPPAREGADGETDCIVAGARRDCIYDGIEDRRLYRETPTPPGMMKIWRRLSAFRSPAATRWVPEKIDVTAHPWDERNCGEVTPEPWPRDWPRPSLPPLVDGARRFTLPHSALPELLRLRSQRTERGCMRPIALEGALYFFEFAERLPSLSR